MKAKAWNNKCNSYDVHIYWPGPRPEYQDRRDILFSFIRTRPFYFRAEYKEHRGIILQGRNPVTEIKHSEIDRSTIIQSDSVMHLVCKWALFLCALLPHAVLGADSNGSTNEDTSNNKSNEDSDGYLGGYDWLLFIGLGLGGAYWFFNSGPDEELKLSYHAVPDSANNQAVLESGFIGKMKKSQRRFVVFYGTQTGTAEEFARRLAKEGARYGLMGLVADLEDCDLDDVKKIKDLESEMGGPTLACFMMATYG